MKRTANNAHTGAAPTAAPASQDHPDGAGLAGNAAGRRAPDWQTHGQQQDNNNNSNESKRKKQRHMQKILQRITPSLPALGADMLDCALDCARRNFNADGYLQAALITGNEDPARPGAIIMLANTSPEAKPAMVRFIHQQREQNDACVLVVECWRSILPPSEFGRAYQERITPRLQRKAKMSDQTQNSDCSCKCLANSI